MPEIYVDCFGCGALLTGFSPAAVQFEGRPGYGSQFDDTLPGSAALTIGICDVCLALRRDRVMTIVREHRPLPPPRLIPWTMTCDEHEQWPWAQVALADGASDFWRRKMARPYWCEILIHADETKEIEVHARMRSREYMQAVSELLQSDFIETQRTPRDNTDIYFLTITDAGRRLLGMAKAHGWTQTNPGS